MKDKIGNELKIGDFIAAPYHVSMTSTTGMRIEVVTKIYERRVGAIYMHHGNAIRTGHPGPENADVMFIPELKKTTKEFKDLHNIRKELLANDK